MPGTSDVTIYHNPRCTKSCQTLALLREHGAQATIIEYLKTPPDAEQLERLLGLLGLEPRELMRTNEAPYRDNNLDDPRLTREQLIAALAEHPILIQRPIVVQGDKAAIGRPPENVLAILK